MTSVLRTDADIKSLSRTNVNASKRSVHCYGTTFDITYVRYHSEKFGINKNKVAVMGYSSGGHLTASLFSFHEDLPKARQKNAYF